MKHDSTLVRAQYSSPLGDMTLGASPELLVLGYLRNQRLVASASDVESITVDWDVGAAAVKTRNGIANIEKLLDYIESDADLFDADRLAFRETLRALQRQISRVGTLPAAKLHKRVGDDLDALAEIEKNYEREMAQIFSRFEKRAITQKREKWGDYLVHLAKRHNREQILKDYAVIEPYSSEKLAAMDASAKVSEKAIAETEIYGKALPPKTIGAGSCPILFNR